MDEKDIWNIEIQLRNKEHQVLDTIIVEAEYAYTDLVEAKMKPLFVPRLHALAWQGFGLWASHVAIKQETTFAHLNFLRNAKKEIVLQCENHNCQWRAIKMPSDSYDECVVCLDAKPAQNRTLMCMHHCCCAECFDRVDACPICRYPK